MPIYEFHCQRCGRDSEILVRSADWSRTTCPHCGSKRLVKQLSVFASGKPQSADASPCTGNPGSCCACGTGRPHQH